mgnify:CR=1 FL=1
MFRHPSPTTLAPTTPPQTPRDREKILRWVADGGGMGSQIWDPPSSGNPEMALYRQSHAGVGTWREEYIWYVHRTTWTLAPDDPSAEKTSRKLKIEPEFGGFSQNLIRLVDFRGKEAIICRCADGLC